MRKKKHERWEGEESDKGGRDIFELVGALFSIVLIIMGVVCLTWKWGYKIVDR